MTRRAAIIVLDGVGIGPASDTDVYGDAGSDSLGNVLRRVGGLSLPNLAGLGLGHCAPLPGVPAVSAPRATATVSGCTWACHDPESSNSISRGIGAC